MSPPPFVEREERVRVLLLLARLTEDTEPTVVAAVDETVWEHWTEKEELRWREHGRHTWGLDEETEWREVWAEFSPDTLAAAFNTPTVQGEVSAA